MSQVLGCGNQKGVKEFVRGQAVITTLLPKVKASFVVEDEEVEAIIELILSICHTGEVGDGKIFIYQIEEADVFNLEAIREELVESGYRTKFEVLNHNGKQKEFLSFLQGFFLFATIADA